MESWIGHEDRQHADRICRGGYQVIQGLPDKWRPVRAERLRNITFALFMRIYNSLEISRYAFPEDIVYAVLRVSDRAARLDQPSPKGYPRLNGSRGLDPDFEYRGRLQGECPRDKGGSPSRKKQITHPSPHRAGE